eukprot:TRINITY_DN4891_c1_g3_i1.p1 TRINITY_DN4891_c1_g3~~TRINITY_DN4891_c1_g3_i1.p1  ORF type:complete len:246 (+),score=30.18 TRINITY_DN4891_c1_g3_i1:41-778(+)
MTARGVRWVALGWVGFIGENLVMSENRELVIEQFGKNAYHGLYGLLSTISMGSVGYGMMKYKTPKGSIAGPRKAISIGLKVVGMMGLSQGFPPLRNIGFDAPEAPVVETSPARPASSMCPIDLSWRKNAEGKEVYGIRRITRHPQLWSLSFLGAGVAIGTTCPVVATASLGVLPVTLILGSHQDSRFKRGIGQQMSETVQNTTSHVPFYAVMTGDQLASQAWYESKKTNAVLAGLATAIYCGTKM